MKYLGTLILASDSLPAEVPLPQAQSTWQDFISVCQFRQDDDLSLPELDRRYGHQQAYQIGGEQKFTALMTSASASSKLPAMPTGALEYGPMAQRHLQFMVASGRWSTLA